MTISRRTLLIASGAAVVAVGGGAALYTYSRPSPTACAATAGGDLMTPGPLGERALGDPDAPVTIIEYASMTCGHCATFHNQTYPRLKAEYIDTGKVRFILREFPLDPVATAAFMLARCLDDERYFRFIDALFAQQATWAYASNPEEALFNMARQAGFTRERFNECLTNQEILDGVNWVKDRAASQFEVRSTPTFFVNGEVVRGAVSFDQFETLINQHLAA